MPIPVNRSLRLPASEYFASAQEKTGIAIHHTVGRGAESTFRYWRSDTSKGAPRLVATAYIIDRDATVFEVFDPSAWAYQFGLTWPAARRLTFERRFIGIEIASEGGLIEHDGHLYCFDRISPRTRKPQHEAFDYGRPYRGYRWFDRYSTGQLDALGSLVDDLCDRFPIPRRFPNRPLDYYGDALATFEGVIGHAMVAKDNSDPAPDDRLWAALSEDAGVVPFKVPVQNGSNSTRLTSRAITELFEDNVGLIDRMDVAAGSLVKALLMELERRRTYLRLQEPDDGAHAIGYEVVQGDRRAVQRLARALGFARATDTVMEVPGG